MSSERTEKPTLKRLTKAREEGQIARSRDLAIAAASVVATIALGKLGSRLVSGLGERLKVDLQHFGDAPLDTIAAGDLQQIVTTGGWALAALVGPIALATMAAGIGMHGFQGGWSFAPGAMKLNWSRLNPGQGVKRFGLMQSGVDTLKTLLMVTVIAYLGWLGVQAGMTDSIGLAWMHPFDAGRRGWLHAEQLLWRVAWALGAMSLADYGLQRYRLMSALKMSKQEIREEVREGEGSAEVKGQIRRIQREMSRRRMLHQVSTATVVITNPTHFAVALRYDRATMSAPRVVAKGQDHLALKIREKARQHGVAIVENKPLAQTLFKTAEVGETIPAPLFNAVAEVLAYLVRIKQLMF
ncbi:MAG: EscU/YscU/HrcU family type III secretion system export apparatus switch protein [Vicinamibacterales bacterium]